ncbi:glutamine synthetase family protein [Streptomyces asoensis]|uniref:glutamine synthetase family protein n=1 Tax=Streptomyces asoensis TaxID=249586 RepID=UPI0033E5271F
MDNQTGTKTGHLSLDELQAAVRRGDISTVMVAVPDMTGRLMGKDLDALHFLSSLPAGPDMCSYVLATNVDMDPLDGYSLSGWHNGYGDLHVIPDLDTIRPLSYLPGTVLIHGDATHPDGHPVDVAPRQMLRTQLAALAELGYEIRAGLEAECVLYQGTEARIQRGGYQKLTPVSPHNLDYALSRPPALNAFFHDLRDALRHAGAPPEAIKTEGSPGQIEVTWPYGDPMRACDTVTLYKHAIRPIAARHRITPTFMAAPQTGVSSGLHLHLSLWRNGAPLFALQPGGELPELLGDALAGLIDALPHLAPLYAPTPNSYKRYARHSFAPTNFTWGFDNRTCAVRVVGHRESTHLEVRTPGADANPYAALAAAIAAITHGITTHPKLPAPCTGDAYNEDGPLPVPSTLEAAHADFTASQVAARAFGPSVVEHYAHAAQTETDAHQQLVTDVELRRGFLRA